MKIQEIDIQDYARQLLEAHGAQAVVEAAQKACAFEIEGKKEDAEIWRHIEAAMKAPAPPAPPLLEPDDEDPLPASGSILGGGPRPGGWHDVH